MANSQLAKELENSKLVAIIRANNANGLIEVAKALRAGGVKFIEVTMTTPGALDILKQASSALPECHLGAGSVIDAPTARLAILAGAKYIVSPTLDIATIEMCNQYSVAAIPGTFTPTEMLTAIRAGADFVKLFPATRLGPQFIKDVKAPLPQLKIIPTGGVNAENAAEFLQAGASAVAAGSSLVGKGEITQERLAKITERAKQFIENIQNSVS